MKLTIREACIEDAGAIRALNTEEMGYDYPLERTREKLALLINRETDKVYVAVVGENIVGYVHANHYELLYAPAMKNIMGIAVSGKYRRCGIGKALLESVEQWATESGAEGVRLVSGGTRIGAHQFYRSMGYGEGRQQLNFKKKL